MPVIFYHRGYRFFFFSNEGTPREPMHVHVRKGKQIAKFWIDPLVQLAESYGFSSSELNKLAKIVENKKKEIKGAWNEYFKS
jgi:hypothetical protein